MVLCIDSLPLVCLVLLISCYCILYFFPTNFRRILFVIGPSSPFTSTTEKIKQIFLLKSGTMKKECSLTTETFFFCCTLEMK